MRPTLRIQHAAAPFIPRQRRILAAAVLSIAAFGNAQTLPQMTTMSGTVTDASGAKVPHAIIQLSKPVEPSLQTKADSNGHFTIEALPGEYVLKASAVGFEIFKNTVHLTVATPTVENISLMVADTRCPVTIEAGPIKALDPSLDLLLPLTPLPPLHLSNKTSKHPPR